MYRSSKSWKCRGLGLLLALHVGLTEAASGPGAADRGRRIFYGQEILQARIAGHSSYLPAAFGRCANCHAYAEPSRPGTPLEARAPVIDRGVLVEKRSRRGGPPFGYDENNFCKTLRSGVDPGYVVLTRTMPRFELDEAQCSALWDYLAKHEGQDDSH